MSKSWRENRRRSDWDDYEPKRKDWYTEEQRRAQRQRKYDWFDREDETENPTGRRSSK